MDQREATAIHFINSSEKHWVGNPYMQFTRACKKSFYKYSGNIQKNNLSKSI